MIYLSIRRCKGRNRTRSCLFTYFLPLAFPVALHQVEQGNCKRRTANDSHRARHCIVKFEPVQIRIETFFKYQHQYRSRIADRINHCDEETHISPNPETGYKTVEENCLKTKIGKVEAKALNKQPHQRRKLQAIVIESDETESYRTCNDQRQQGRKNFDMTFH